MKLLLILGGIHSLFFTIFHISFWKLLHWKKQLAKLDDTNNAVTQILNLRLIFVFGFHAFVCFWFVDELLFTSLGHAFLIGSSLFWIGRTVEQFYFRKLLPMKHPFSILTTFLFIVGSIIYLIPLIA